MLTLYNNYLSDLQRVAFFVLKRWKSGDASFSVKKTSFEERKMTLKEVFVGINVE